MDFDDVAASGLTKKELLGLRREKDKLEKTLGGIRDMPRTPQAVWIVDTKKEHLAVDEARKLRIPIIGILDTNCDPDEVDFAVPGNDDAIRSVSLLTRVIADAVADGLMSRSGGQSTGEAGAAAEPMPDWERELLGAQEERLRRRGCRPRQPSDAPRPRRCPAEAPPRRGVPLRPCRRGCAPTRPPAAPLPADEVPAEVAPVPADSRRPCRRAGRGSGRRRRRGRSRRAPSAPTATGSRTTDSLITHDLTRKETDGEIRR